MEKQRLPTYQARVHEWMIACFGDDITASGQERAFRFLEEALELVQAIGCTQSEAHTLVDYVFGRSVGEKAQEAGGVMVTLATLSTAFGLDMTECGDAELARCWSKIDVIREKHKRKPAGIRTALPGQLE